MARSFTVRPAADGRPLADWLADQLRLTRPAVERLVQQGKVRVSGRRCKDARQPLVAGQRVEVDLGPVQTDRPAAKKLPPVEVVHIDAHVVVAEKPPGLTTARSAAEAKEQGARARRFLPPTLADHLAAATAPEADGPLGPLRAVHRLDNETSGLVAFARTAAAERHLAGQLRAHTAERLYLALVRGRAREGRIESWLVRDRGDGRRGSAPEGAAGGGQHAVTHVRVAAALGAYTLVECRLETGRTHQVRIHLGEAGTPLCGERVYDRPPHGKPLPDGSGAERVCLHAAVLGFEHPATGQRVRWTSDLPADMAGLLARLRRAAERGGGGG